MNAEFDYFEDLQVGRIYRAPRSFLVTSEDVISFANNWDWRPQHINEAAAQRTVFKGLIASGSHVIAIWTRLSLTAQESEPRQLAILAGVGCEFRLLHAVRPGDELSYQGTIASLRNSESRDDCGVVETLHQLHNQDRLLIFEAKSTSLVHTRASKLSESNPA